MYLYDIDVDVLVNGKPIKKLSHDGKVFVESKHWTEYSIRIKNNGWNRRLMVVSVDGMNVIDGAAAGKTSAGYVVNGYSSTEIKGFRTSNDTVHPFKFNRKERSYAAKSDETNGDTSNCGVIGVAVYSEKEKPKPQPKITYNYHTHIHPTPRPSWNEHGNPYCGDMLNTYTTSSCDLGAKGRSRSATSAPNGTLWGAQLMGNDTLGSNNVLRALNLDDSTTVCDMDVPDMNKPRGFDMGTEFSEHAVADKVVDVDFETGTLLSTISIYYASREGLLHMGVPVYKQTQITMPNPFPNGFCKPPRK